MTPSPPNGTLGALTPPQSDPLDFTSKYNTPLPADKQAAYAKWAKKLGQDPDKGRYDYDLQGAFLAGLAPDGRGHLDDQFKKPNEPTFSDQSQYHGVDGYTGGTWINAPGGRSGQFYQPSATNLKFQGQQELQNYFTAQEPDYRLLPPATVAPPAVNMQPMTLGRLLRK
jgi:hypothetical protein